jgi:hypothetical protein
MTPQSNGLLSRLATAGLLLALAAAPTPSAAGPVLPDFSPSNFVAGAPIDNPYFPLTPGTRYRASGTVTDPDTGETTFEQDEDFVTFETEVIGGVTARVVHARGWEDGVLVEDTRDWYAQDISGNVWYLGEDTTAFEYDDDGNLVGTSNAGSWRTGVNGAKPGYIMPADRTIGLNHYQEFAPADEALDQATILSLNETITVPAGMFTDVLKTREESEVEPGVIEFKYYARGVGLILTEEDLDESGIPQTSIALDSVTTTAVVALPNPVAASLVAAVVLGLPVAVRKKRPLQS